MQIGIIIFIISPNYYVENDQISATTKKNLFKMHDILLEFKEARNELSHVDAFQCRVVPENEIPITSLRSSGVQLMISTENRFITKSINRK